MELFLSCSIAVLETTFVLVGLLLLHGLRKVIGNAAFYIALGFLLIFTQLVSATELKVVLGDPLVDFYIAQTVFFLPYLAALLIVYVTEGTLATQRLIIGAMATLGFFVYLSHLTAVQCNWFGYSISQGPSADSLDFLLRKSQRAMAGSILAQTLDLFLIPIFFQRLRNLGCRLFIAVVGALILTQVVDNFVYVTACYWGDAQWWYQLNSSYLAKAVLTIWLSIFATLYIERIEEEVPGEGRGTLDIILAFFGSYGKAQTLQQHVQEWVDRYKMVVENASDMILLLDEKGEILDANFAAMRILNITLRDAIIGKLFPEMILDSRGEAVRWEEYVHRFKIEDTSYGSHIQRLECLVKFPLRDKVELDIAISGIQGVDDTPMFIAMGRDVSERNRLSREQHELREQLAHKQRLESIGQLAGGVAHDFNNYLHAIQGHLDLITYMYDIEDDDIDRHLGKINDVTEKASMLTKQLLGFARKGNYVVKTLSMEELAKETAELFKLNTQENIDFQHDIRSKEIYVRGDQVQLQQVFLNLLLNSRDAVKSCQKDNIFIRLILDYAVNEGIHWAYPSEIKIPPQREDYCAFVVEDNGTGIDEDTINHIFEPFFTTKPPGEGTGMGLAMAYGTIINHRGWINVESKLNQGTTFTVFLPIAVKPD